MFMNAMTPADPATTRAAFARFPSGVAALCALVDGEPTALVASSFQVGVSLDPPLVLFAVQNSSTTWPNLRQARRIGVNVLGSDHDRICRQLASRDKAKRFDGLDLHVTDQGGLFLPDAPLALECEIESETPAGDHHVVLLKVVNLMRRDDLEPLVIHGSTFRTLV